MAVAADVPDRYDVVINAIGYMFAYSEQIKGESGYTPLFVPRENTQGDYGDNQFDFWLTFSQNDWSLGAFQRFLRVNDEDSRRQFWQGSRVNVDRPGEVRLSRNSESNTAGAAIQAVGSGETNVWFATSTNLIGVSGASGAESDKGAHGLSATPSEFALIDDGSGDVYISSSDSGSVGIRQWNGSAFATHSNTAADALAFLNNTLYGYNDTTGILYSFGTGAQPVTATTIHTFQGADGTAKKMSGRLQTFGTKLMLALILGATAGTTAPPDGYATQIWEYDGVGVARFATFPRNFTAWHMETLEGSLFVGGYFVRHGVTAANLEYKPAIYVISGGTEVLLWEGYDYEEGVILLPRPMGWDQKLWWAARDPDTADAHLFSYNPATGAITPESEAPFVSPGKSLLGVNNRYMLTTFDGTTGYELFPHPSGGYESTGFIKTSLFDGDSTLQKHWETVQVEFDSASDGDGGSVDIARAFDSLEDSDYSNVQTGATSGTEYAINAQSREISLKITLNKGTSTEGPVLKAVRVRGAPINPAFRRERYVLNLGSVDGTQPVQRRDGTVEPQDGLEMAQDLRTAFTSGDDFSVTDEFGTYDAVFEPNGLRIMRTAAEEYIAVVELRES